MRIEEPQLLAAMNRIERVVDVERDPFRDLPKGFAIKIDHGAAHAQQGASVGQVLQTEMVDREHSSLPTPLRNVRRASGQPSKMVGVAAGWAGSLFRLVPRGLDSTGCEDPRPLSPRLSPQGARF